MSSGDPVSPGSASADADQATLTVTRDRCDWSELLDRADSTIFHDPRWGELMQRVYGNRPFYLTAKRDGQVVAALQLVHQKSFLFGSRLSSLPYFDASGILGDDRAGRRELVKAARALADELGVESVELRQFEPVDESLPTRTDKVTMHLRLPQEPDEAWSALKAKVRNQVRKATKAGLVCRQGGIELVRQFYDLYAANMRILGSPPHSRRFFESIIETFPERARILVVAKDDGRAAAASLTLEDSQALRVPWAGSDHRVRQLCPNMLLYWEMIAQACRSQGRCFDFGRGTRDGGTYRFKRQWGAQEVPLHWQYLLSPGKEMPDLRPDSAKYRLMVACWRKLPMPVAKLLGPGIISKLS